jgi:hypothetical protein
MEILDQSGDTLGVDLYRLANLYEAPAWVKAASADRLTGAPTMPARAFAAPTRRQFPTHTAPATWLSTAYFAEKRAAFDPDEAATIAANLAAAADYWGIRGEYDRVVKAAAAGAADDLAALPDHAFALVEEVDGKVERRLPLRGDAEIKAAAAWLVQYRDEFTQPDRMRIARKVAGAAGVGVLGTYTDAIDRIAGFGTCAAKRAAALVKDRALRLRPTDGALAAQLDRLAAGLDSRAPRILEKVAAALDEVDRAYGLQRRYDQDVDRPDDVLFAVTGASVNEIVATHAWTKSGAAYARADLTRLRAADLRDRMGDDFVDRVSADGIFVAGEKLAEALADSTEDAVLFDRAAAELGITPARPPDPLRADLVDLAAVLAAG